MVYKADQFSFDAAEDTYVAEASMLGLPPGVPAPEQIVIDVGTTKDPLKLLFKRTAADMHGLHVQGWRYIETAIKGSSGNWSPVPTTPSKALIIND